MAENVTATPHNIYTLRAAPVRDPLNWSKYIAEALYRFGLQAEVMFASHHLPRWGNARIQEVLRAQRDLYAHMNNQVLHLANQGVTINQIHNVYELPKSLQQKWECRGYHGSAQHNARGVVQRRLRAAQRRPQGAAASTSSPDVIRAMTTELFLNFLAIRMDSRKAEGLRFTINLVTPDNCETFVVELENATLTSIAGFQADKPDLTLTIDRSALEQTMMGAKTLEAQIADGTAKVQGDVSVLAKLAAIHAPA